MKRIVVGCKYQVAADGSALYCVAHSSVGVDAPGSVAVLLGLIGEILFEIILDQ